MDDWKLEPAHDHGLPPLERYQSLQREGGLPESLLRLGWWSVLRGTFRVWNRLSIAGREHLPAQPSFVLVANHSSHLDAMVLGSMLPLHLRDRVFPLAAHDVFFERQSTAAFASAVINALPVKRRVTRMGLTPLRERLLAKPSVYILFPEGGRTRDGAMKPFKSGVGQLVAGTSVPVLPCFLDGTFTALPAGQWLLRPRHIGVRIGPPLLFHDIANDRDGWNTIASRLECEVKRLGGLG